MIKDFVSLPLMKRNEDNQMGATQALRQQLFHLSNIDRNTGSIDKNTKYIKAIYNKMSSGNTLRAKGLQ